MVHISPYAGRWYPDEPDELRAVLSEAFENSCRRTGGTVYPRGIGFVVPHAAPVYSGTVAASVYRHLQHQQPRRILMLGFSHSKGHRGIYVPAVDAYRTPLGEVPVDRGLLDNLRADPAFRSVDESRVCDHSVEIQFPLLQSVLPHCPVAPLYVGRLDSTERRDAAAALAQFIDGQTVVIASSDLTHYGRSFGYEPFPLNRRTGERLNDLDHGTIDAASSLDPPLFLDEIRETGSTVCGLNPIALLLETMRQVQESRSEEIFQASLDYQTSGEITGDFGHSVSYGALGYFPASSFELDAEDQARLFEAARTSLDRFIATGLREAVPAPRTTGLNRPTSAFVTIYHRTLLKGCIGRMNEATPMYAGVPRLTLTAALEDGRFEPVHRGDTSLSLEISVLTPTKRVTSPEALIPAQHGGYVENGDRRGLLLPKVAEEHHMNREQFLVALARKADLPARVYELPDTRLRVFRAQVFGDRKKETTVDVNAAD
jgi:AmmeMemoRadiSam system protein B/AmmeMemoRadiSam system protein A